MRRGHPGSGGWRNENQRHFRPRVSGPQRFRAPRSFSLLETPRFPPPGPRLHRTVNTYNTHQIHAEDHGSVEHHERNNYRNQFHHPNTPRQERSHQQRSRSAYVYPSPNLKKDDNTQSSPYKHQTNFYSNMQVEPFQVNSLGDIDHRQLASAPQHQETYNIQRVHSWVNPQLDQRHFYEDRSPQKYYRHHDAERQVTDGNRIPTLDYTGHRPPASDHYGSTSYTIMNNNNTSFSRSVDDTVDIVRKRLLSRNDPQRVSQDTGTIQNNSEQEVREHVIQNTQQDQPTKNTKTQNRTQRQRIVKSNCDKMKTNIVHQLFKMDKDKMHKLMDDPGSSSKFEYAISSLITESQNSLNRHLRSVAEKSLESNSNDFIHNDNNTIYEDTFMKQMQCLLDPQDTVLLEDIKPLVMAELSKVLQLDDFEPRYDAEDQSSYQLQDHHQIQYANYENFNYDEYPQETFYDVDDRIPHNFEDSNRTDVNESRAPNYEYANPEIKNEENYVHAETLFERRHSRKSDHSQDRRHSVESQRGRRSLDKTIEDIYNISEEALPLFDTNAEQLSEEEDTFAELDKQYHVAVDHNFIDDVSARTTPNPTQAEINTHNIKKENDCQLQSPPETSTKLVLTSTPTQTAPEKEANNVHIKKEILQSPDFAKENNTPTNSDNITPKIENIDMKHSYATKCKDRETEKSNISKTSQSNSRKRSIDQRPAHRKEKRKKSESSNSEPAKRSLQKQDSTDSRTAHSKSTEKPSNTSKPYYSIFTSKEDSSKDVKNKGNNTTEKDYSDKYVKRKRSSKSRDRETHKKRSSSSSSQTLLSPKESCNSNSTLKSDSKTKLKTIDMFVEQPKKVSVHQAHRNTATTPATTPKPVEENKNKQATTPACKTVHTKTVSTQVIKRVISKETQTVESKCFSNKYIQTEKLKYLSKAFQTPRWFLEKPKSKTKEPFERMKEIDMEIQALLQEKFKLYNNLESKDACPSSVKLGMTVLNVTPIDDEEDSSVPMDADSVENAEVSMITQESVNQDALSNPDAIIDDFTSIPVEELEQIALESVQEVNFDDSKPEKRNVRQKALQQERLNSESPKSTSSRKSNKKRKTPNISLIEKIITDDRPLEDIISLDDFEDPAPKQNKKTPKSRPKKKVSKKSKAVKSNDAEAFDLKECSVILIQTDISKYINATPSQMEERTVKIESSDNIEELKHTEYDNKHPVPIKTSLGDSKGLVESPNVSGSGEVVVESEVNDLQFDMLDVSEDIVIGESCEIKDKDSSGQSIAVSEDLILDNSQSSADDAVAPEPTQPENECKTYDYSTDEELRRDSLTVTGNVDAVLAVECIENDFIAACLDGNVYHFSGDGQLLNTMRGSNLAVTCLTIVKEKYGTTIYTGSLDSRIRYYDLDTGLEKGPECNVLSPIQTMDRAWDTVFVGTRTGFVLQFECKNNMLIPVSTVKFSEQAILALRAMKEGPRKVLLVASRSEDVTIKDAQTGLLLRTLLGPKMTVYTLLFEDGKVYCGTSSHQIHVFDYASGTHTGCHEGGKGAVCLRATGGLLFAGCYDGCIYVYREGETRPLAQLRGPSLMLLSLAVVGSKIIAGYKDRSLYIWKIPLSILQEMIL